MNPLKNKMSGRFIKRGFTAKTYLFNSLCNTSQLSKNDIYVEWSIVLRASMMEDKINIVIYRFLEILERKVNETY